MADFKIDRIRFKWKGDWLAGTQYVKDDIVRYGAKVYTCIEVHIADSNFYNDLDNATPKWSLTMSGQSWTGNWQPNKFYKIGEVASQTNLSTTVSGTVSSFDPLTHKIYLYNVVGGEFTTGENLIGANSATTKNVIAVNDQELSAKACLLYTSDAADE